MCVGQYTDSNGMNHPIDREIEDVHRVPWSPGAIFSCMHAPSLGHDTPTCNVNH